MLDYGEHGSGTTVGGASGALTLTEDAGPTTVGDISSAFATSGGISGQSVVACRPRTDSFINAPPSPASILTPPEGIFSECDEITYNNGVHYGVTFVEDHFPVLSIILKDGRVVMRNTINVMIGTGKSASALDSIATQIISELAIKAAVLGHPVERGKYYRIRDSVTNPWQQESGM